jgi:hypothetical protein
MVMVVEKPAIQVYFAQRSLNCLEMHRSYFKTLRKTIMKQAI